MRSGSSGLPEPSHADVIRIIGLSVPEAIAALAPGQSASAHAALGHHFKTAFPHVKEEIAHRDPLYPGIKSVVEALAARDDMALGIATGKSRRGMVRLFDQESWHPHFVTVQTADDHPSKPHPSMIVTAMADAGVAPGRTIMIGDTTFDMVMGLQRRCRDARRRLGLSRHRRAASCRRARHRRGHRRSARGDRPSAHRAEAGMSET